jgi:energy-converting hydrogenase A subunit M
VLRHWDIESIEGLDAEAEQARTRLVEYIARVDRVGQAMVRRRERRLASTTA